MTDRIYFGFSVGNTHGCHRSHRHHHRHGHHYHNNWNSRGSVIDDIFRRHDFMGHRTYFGWNPPFRGHGHRQSYHNRFHTHHGSNYGWNSHNSWHHTSRNGQIFHRDPYYDNWGAGHATELVERLAWSPYVYAPYTGH